ncbi:MAG: c-type cytochrome [Lautropia sp.]
MIAGLPSRPAHADEALAKARMCLACHAVDRKVGIGPAFRDVAAKYASDKNAKAKLSAKIRNGSSGVWGRAPMPANPKVTEAEANALAAWVLSR